MGKWTRRAFLTSGVMAGGALVFGVAIRPGNRTPDAAKYTEGVAGHQINTWVKIKDDNSITIIVPHAEMGQGAHTSVAMMLAEEMDADWSSVNVEEAPAHSEFVTDGIARDFILPGSVPKIMESTVNGTFLALSKLMNLQITGGSFSVRGTGVRTMQVAGAAIRELLVRAAAEQWAVPANEINTQNSHLLHPGRGLKAAYVDFADAVANKTPSATPKLKAPEQYTIIGNSNIQRLDVPSKVDGSAQFGVDVNLPNMKVATIKASPVFGESVESIDSSKALALRGVQKVVDLGDAVAVIADGYWVAKKALGLVGVTFTKRETSSLDSAHLVQQFKDDLDKAQSSMDFEKDIVEGDTDSAFTAAEQVVSAEYSIPWLAHATMEPMNCTALMQEGVLSIWTGTQMPLGLKAGLADELEIDEEKIEIHNQYLGGGFGRRANVDYAKQASLLAMEVPGTPVKLIWSREEDTQHDHYRQAMVSRFRGALGADRLPTAWWNLFHDKHEPVEAPDIPYSIANKSISYIDSPTHVPFGPWRSVDHSAHAFFTESFIDELAFAAGIDAFEYRKRLLAENKRALQVLETAAEMSEWGADLGPGRGQGIALHESFGTIVAQVARVRVSAGQLRVEKVFCAADPGRAVSPDGFVAQMESGIVYGLTAALYGEISIEEGAVKQTNFHNYRMLRMNESPDIEVKIIESGLKIGGAGEPGTPPIAPAVANAVFSATGTRQRNLPLTI